MVRVPGGLFTMGSDAHYPEERPSHLESVADFWIDTYPVTNRGFARFVNETGYLTVAERAPSPADYPHVPPTCLVAGSLVFMPPNKPVSLDDPRAWWAYVAGASWRAPTGPGSSIHGRAEHPVVHVALEDALAYAGWAGKDLPTEAEWERAARGGLEGATYSWGDELEPHGWPMANTWRGEFPWLDLKPAATSGTSRVGSFPPNGYGLFDMIGNVWEWTKDAYVPHSASRDAATCCAASRQPALGARVVKGGSYLCSPDHCARYRPAARQPLTADSSSCHVGFRCVVRTVNA